jgi:signal transduction histidine kinase
LLDDLVEYARLSNDAERGARFDANLVVDSVIESLSSPIRRSDAEITHEVLPHITANTGRFERLMQNLIGNALKYVAEDVRPCVRVEAARESAFWRFSVSDNGIGIDPRHFERIFEPFKRLHNRGRYDGTGLGLAICRKIVESFGGRISVRSSEGQGSTFSFTIPIDQEEGPSHDS